MPGSNRRHQAPEACALSAELIALKGNTSLFFYHVVSLVKEDLNRPIHRLSELSLRDLGDRRHLLNFFDVIIVLKVHIWRHNQSVGVRYDW